MAEFLGNVEKEIKSGNVKPINTEELDTWLSQPRKKMKNKIMLLYGEDATGKTGVLLQYLVENRKKTLYLDVDGNAEGLLDEFYPEADFINLKNPLVPMIKEGGESFEIIPDYKNTFKRIQYAIYKANIEGGYDAIVIDGLSTLLIYAGEQMKMDKNLQTDGKVNMQYWNARKINFMGILEQVRMIREVDKFFIAHDDFIYVPGTIKVQMGNEIVNLGKTNAVVTQTARMMDQRVFLEVDEDQRMGVTKYKATVHKYRQNSAKVNETVVFNTVSNGKANWDKEKVLSLFESRGKE